MSSTENRDLPTPVSYRDKNKNKVVEADPEIIKCPCNFVKGTFLTNIVLQLVAVFVSINFPGFVISVFFEASPDPTSEKLIQFYAFSHILPLFLCLQSFLQIDLEKAKLLCLPLAIDLAATAFAMIHIKQMKDWTMCIYCIFMLFVASSLSNLISYFLA